VRDRRAVIDRFESAMFLFFFSLFLFFFLFFLVSWRTGVPPVNLIRAELITIDTRGERAGETGVYGARTELEENEVKMT